ncbi:MAG: CYTH domain-containing protein [Clostridiales Family XIII bacterium]|nr:CYTH domain-containing protein [Clostridiales Family XIII bacterium]
MEIELKYKIDGVEQYEKILKDPWIAGIAESGEPEVVRMKAAYFDTEDHALIRHNIAFRIRSEGERTFATLKWRDDDDGISGLYIRSEINIPISDQTCFFNPDPGLFKESPEGRDLLDVTAGKPLINVCDMVFTRRRIRIDYGESILELALDEGVIVAGAKSVRLCELEIEVYSGGKDDLLAVGKKIAGKYGLKPEPKTKFTRGVELLAPCRQ